MSFPRNRESRKSGSVSVNCCMDSSIREDDKLETVAACDACLALAVWEMPTAGRISFDEITIFMKYFLIALQFLTLIPVRLKDVVSDADMAKSLIYFPIVGGVLGLLLYPLTLLAGVLPWMVVTVLIIIALYVITGGLHVDGFADMCDGFYGYRAKEDRLRIMRDSCIGVMGVVGIVSLFSLRVVSVYSLAPAAVFPVLVSMCVVGRWAQVFSCVTSSYARDEGKGKSFMAYVGRRELFVATGFALLIVFFSLGLRGVLVCPFVVCALFLFRYVCQKKIGGMTGDTIGSANEIAEIVFLLGSVYFYGRG